MATRIYKTPFAATGDKEPLATADQPDGKVSLQAGWTPDYELPNDNANYRPVGRAEMNGVLNELTAALGELQLNGFSKWQAIDGGWPVGAQVNHGGLVYRSLIDSNLTEPGIAGADWVLMGSGIATTAQAQALTDNTVLMTPSNLVSAMDILRGSRAFIASGNFVVPAGVSVLYITGCGAGGGGAAYNGTTSGGGGGGGGGSCLKAKVTVAPGDTISVTIGTGGGGGQTANAAGAAGGATSFGSLVTLSGGAGGGSAAAGGVGGGVAGAAGQVATTGQRGEQYNPLSLSQSQGGHGGSTMFGVGGYGGGQGSGNLSGQNAQGFGSGGGGGAQGVGGSGANGFLIVEW